MKNLFFTILVLFCAFSLSAQDVNQSLSAKGTNLYYAGVSSDTITNTDTWTYSVDLSAKGDIQLYNIHMKLDSLSGTPAHTINTYGTFDGTKLIAIDTVSWKGTSADTTFVLSNLTTGILYKKLYIRVTGSSTSKSSVEYIWGKVINKTHE